MIVSTAFDVEGSRNKVYEGNVRGIIVHSPTLAHRAMSIAPPRT